MTAKIALMSCYAVEIDSELLTKPIFPQFDGTYMILPDLNGYGNIIFSREDVDRAILDFFKVHIEQSSSGDIYKLLLLDRCVF